MASHSDYQTTQYSTILNRKDNDSFPENPTLTMLSTVSGPGHMLKLINQRRGSKRENTSQMKEMSLNDQLYKKITSNDVNVSP